MGSGRPGESRDDARREARGVPLEHFQVGAPTPEPVAAPEPSSPAAPPDLAVLQLIRDRTTGRFQRKAVA
jgi:hypothetical protein